MIYVTNNEPDLFSPHRKIENMVRKRCQRRHRSIIYNANRLNYVAIVSVNLNDLSLIFEAALSLDFFFELQLPS